MSRNAERPRSRAVIPSEAAPPFAVIPSEAAPPFAVIPSEAAPPFAVIPSEAAPPFPVIPSEAAQRPTRDLASRQSGRPLYRDARFLVAPLLGMTANLRSPE